MDRATEQKYYQMMYNIGSGENIDQAEAIIQNMLSNKIALRLHQYNQQNAQHNAAAFNRDRQIAVK